MCLFLWPERERTEVADSTRRLGSKALCVSHSTWLPEIKESQPEGELKNLCAPCSGDQDDRISTRGAGSKQFGQTYLDGTDWVIGFVVRQL